MKRLNKKGLLKLEIAPDTFQVHVKTRLQSDQDVLPLLQDNFMMVVLGTHKYSKPFPYFGTYSLGGI